MYETIKLWTCKVGRIEKLYAFTYQPQAPEREFNGWDLYDARKEWARLGVGKEGSNTSWRISHINADYGVRFQIFSRVVFGVILTFSVFANVSGAASSPRYDLRQYNQLRGTISLESKNTCFDISPSS